MMSFVAGKSISVYLSLFAVLGLGWTEDIPIKNSELTGVIGLRRSSPSLGTSCVVPPQPANGVWKLHRSYCGQDVDCGIPQGLGIPSGSQLVYSCDPGYRIETDIVVYCTAKGNWSATPNCIQIKCESLNSLSGITTCYHSDGGVDCNFSVLPKTQAQVSCRPGYRKDTESLLEQGESVVCNQHGKWEPDPIRCRPACGLIPTRQPTFAIDKNLAKINDLPWAATLYVETSSPGSIKKTYSSCGATLIRANLVLTLAYCVYNLTMTPDSAKAFVNVGDIFPHHNHPDYDSKTDSRRMVKNIYVHCNYKGFRKFGTTSNIALLELQQPFVLTSILLPACLNVFGDSDQIVEPGAYGRVPGFLKPDKDSVIDPVTVSYMPHSECNATINADRLVLDISNDTFCTGYRNGSRIQLGRPGGGLIFKKNDQWYVMGLHIAVYVSPRRITEKSQSDFHGVLLNVKISSYIPWILKVIFNLERLGSHPPCSSDTSSVQSTTETPTPTVRPTHIQTPNLGITDFFSCSVPPQPDNGELRFQGDLCKINEDCKIPQGIVLKPGSQLIYSCSPGYRPGGNTEIYCRETGNWSAIPLCIEIKCVPLNLVSTMSTCSHDGKSVSCDFPVLPGTRAEVSCRPGYKNDAVSISSQKGSLICTENGKWNPDPIKCVPDCGAAMTPQTLHSVGGTLTSIDAFPWHASLYLEMKTRSKVGKIFQCGATIIHTSFLLTAAHCVYDETIRVTKDPEKLFVMTGNIFRDFDFSGHNPQVVRKGEVKHVYVHSNYYGLVGNYGSDIAMLELKQPFEFSRILLPACLDIYSYSEQILEPGAYGRVAGFGRTATAQTSAVLQTVTIPYVTYRQCKKSKNAEINDFLISNDKFCAGYTNGTAVCDGDSGGGLVFQRNDLWYVMGIVSGSLGVDFSSGEKMCDRNSYALYIKVATYMQWIQDVLSNPERFKF